MEFIPVPGYGAGILENEGNLAQYIDKLVLGSHIYKYTGTWDPEGILSTIPAIGTTLIGVLTGQYLRSNRNSLEKAVNLFLFGNLCIVIGALWDSWFPINKNLWTSSYVAFAGGIALVILAACYYFIDIKKYIMWTKPFVILGMNAIAVYVVSEIALLVAIFTNVTLADGRNIPLREFIYENYFASWAGQLHGSFLFAFAYLMLWLGTMAILYKRRIFIKA
jgi:predicted acyltransferase